MTKIIIGTGIVLTVTLLVNYSSYRFSDVYTFKTKHPIQYQSLMQRLQDAEKRLLDSRTPEDKDSEQNTLIQIGTLYEEMANYSKAIANYKKAIDINEVHIIPWTNLASIYKAQGKYRKAYNIYKKLTKMFPKDTQSYNNLAELYIKFNIGDKEEIIEIIKEGVAQTGDRTLEELEEIIVSRK